MLVGMMSICMSGNVFANDMDQNCTSQNENPCCYQEDECGIRPTIEAKAGYFFFWDDKMSDVYDHGGVDLQISATYPVWRWLQVYLSVEGFEKNGRSLKGHQKTRFWGYPVSLGLQAVAEIIPEVQYYFTMGPRYIYAHVHNNSPYVDRTMNHSTVGGFANTGFRFFPMEHFLIDLFGEFSYAQMHFRSHKKNAYGERAQVGGLVFGGGLGYAF